MEKVVGNGAFGVVWRAREESGNGTQVAIKKVVLDRRYHNRELEMMKGLDHECVIKLHHHFEKPGRKRDETYLHLVMDFLPQTIRSVALARQKADSRSRLPIEDVTVYLYQTLKALQYVHSKRICHRDLKPDNLLVDPASRRLKLIDFGCAKVLVKGQPNVSYICSRYYRAPELMFGATEYTCAVDMWSLGTIMVELLIGHLPFQGQDSTQQHLVEIMKILGTPTERDLRQMRATCSIDDLPKLKPYPWERIFPSFTPPPAIDLARQLLCYDPMKRLTAEQALLHPFFADAPTLLETEAPRQRSPEGSAIKTFQRELASLFSSYADQRNAKLNALLPKLDEQLQRSLTEAASSEPSDERSLEQTVLGHVKGALKQCEQAEASQFLELEEAVKRAVLGGAARAEVATLRSELTALQAQLAERTQAAHDANGGGADGGGGGGPPSSGRRAVNARVAELSGAHNQGTASPVVARQSCVVGGGEDTRMADVTDGSSGGRARPVRMQTMSALADDELGQVTPVGAGRERGDAASAPRQGAMNDGE